MQAVSEPPAGRVLVIDDQIPSPSVGSGYGRMYDTLVVLGRAPDLEVVFHPRLDVPVDEALVRELQDLGVRIVPSLEAYLRDHGDGVDVVVVSRPHNFRRYADDLERLIPHVPVVYDAEAVYYRRAEMQAALVADEEERARLTEEAAQLRVVEQRLFERADEVICISDDEAAIAATHTSAPIRVIEAWLADAEPTDTGFAERSHIGFVAGWNAGANSPNADGLLWLGREVLPILRTRLPDFRLLVTGANPPPNVQWLAGDNVTFVGRIDDLNAFYGNIRVAISPVRFGAGVKLKSVEALQSGVPLVATREGAAGLDPALAGGYFATDDPERFATCLATLLTDEAAWTASREKALGARALQERAGRTIAAWPAIIREHLDAHRGVSIR